MNKEKVDAANRTKLELKLEIEALQAVCIASANRTKLELKLDRFEVGDRITVAANRTKLELKQRSCHRAGW